MSEILNILMMIISRVYVLDSISRNSVIHVMLLNFSIMTSTILMPLQQVFQIKLIQFGTRSTHKQISVLLTNT